MKEQILLKNAFNDCVSNCKAILVKILGRIERSESTFIGFTKAILEHFDEFIIENTDEGLIMPFQQMMKAVAFDLIHGDKKLFFKK